MLKISPVDKNNPVPLYYQLKMLLLKEIQMATHPYNIPLPSEERIAKMCGISRTTVRQAINELVTEGWLCRVRSKGTFVPEGQRENNIAESSKKYGITVHWIGEQQQTEVLDFSTMSDPKAALLRPVNKANYTVTCIVKRKYCNGSPAAIFRIYQIRAYGLHPGIQQVRHMFRTTEAKPEDMKILKLEQSEPLQEIISTGFNHQGHVVEYTISRYCSSICRVEVKDCR